MTDSRSAFPFPDGQDWIIQPMKSLRYYSEDGGVCHPIALAAMMELFNGNLDGFYAYLGLLHFYSQHPENHNLEHDIEDVKSLLSQTNQLQIGFELTDKQKRLLEIDALFNLIEVVYNSCKSKLKINNKENDDRELDNPTIFSILLPEILAKKGGITELAKFHYIYNHT